MLKGMVAVGGIAVVVLMILLLWEMNQHVGHLDDRTALIEAEVAGGGTGKQPDLHTTVRQFLPRLQRLNRELGSVASDTGKIRLLTSVDSSLNEVARSVRTIGVLPTLLTEIRLLRGDMGGLRGDIGRLKADTSGIPRMENRLDDLARELGGVRTSLETLPPILRKVAKHVRNLDRKTGPGIPATPAR